MLGAVLMSMVGAAGFMAITDPQETSPEIWDGREGPAGQDDFPGGGALLEAEAALVDDVQDLGEETAEDSAGVIEEFTKGRDYLVVSYDASNGLPPPEIGLSMLENGDQIVTADGVEVARLTQPEVPADESDIDLVAVMV